MRLPRFDRLELEWSRPSKCHWLPYWGGYQIHCGTPKNGKDYTIADWSWGWLHIRFFRECNCRATKMPSEWVLG